MKLNTFLIAVLLAASLSTSAAHGQSGFKLVVHPSNPTSSLTREQAAKLFLKKANTWSDGRAAVPVDQPESSAVRVAFSKLVLGKKISEVQAYWQQQIFSGRAIPPVEKPTDAQVVRFVAGNELAIGYVAEGAATGELKVVRISD